MRRSGAGMMARPATWKRLLSFRMLVAFLLRLAAPASPFRLRGRSRRRSRPEQPFHAVQSETDCCSRHSENTRKSGPPGSVKLRMSSFWHELLYLIQGGRFDEAAQALGGLSGEAARQPLALHWLGVVRWRQGRLDEARELLASAVRDAPSEAVFLANFGAVLMGCGEPAKAAEQLRRALAIRPDMAGAHNNLANALRALGRIDEAGRHYEAALSLNPNLPAAHNNLANIRKEQGDVPGALAGYREALKLDPDFRMAFSNLLALTRLADDMPPAEVFALHRQFGERFEAPLRAHWPKHANQPDPGRRLRIGYVSPDCHPAALFFLRPVWARHDASRLEVYAYFDEPPPEATDPPAGFHPRVLRGLTDAQVLELIRKDAIDVLIDVAGHAGRSRILVFAHKPAPVQITWLDYLGTTGLAAMDYRLTDRFADPPGAEAFHSERLLYMPAPYCQWCYPGGEALAVGDSPLTRNGYPTFGSFNNPIKITPRTLALWQRILTALPTARLCLFGIDSEATRDAIRQSFATRRQAERIELLPRLPYPDFLAACGMVDVALDPIHFSGATTTCDVLWMGVPVVTLPGASSASRSSAAILTVLGLADFVAADESTYVEIARRWAADVPALSALRRGLRDRMQHSPLMDAAGFARAFEARLRECWVEWCARGGNRHG